MCRLILGAVTLSASLALATLAPAQAADAPENHPFAGARNHLRVDRVVRTRGAIVVSIRLDPQYQAGLEAHAGLFGAGAEITELPGPAGMWHVRIVNTLKRPLLVPAGEVLLTPAGPSRLTDRAVWIGAGAATFVPVVQVIDPAPSGPYLTRGRGLTPTEQTILDLDRLRARIRFRNRAMEVGNDRLDDAAAAYVTERFRARVEPYRQALLQLVDGEGVVGFVVAGENGPHYAHIETDASRFKTRWPALVDALAMDAMLVEDAGLAPKPGDKAALRNHVTKLIRGLGPESIQRPNFGHGVEHRWLVKGENALWTGLAVDDKPVCLTLHRQAVLPQNPAGPNNPGGQPRGPGPGGSGGGETERQPGVYELERKVRRTPYEERLLDRTKALRQKPNPSRARPPIRSRPTRPTPNRPSPARPSTSPSVPRPVAPSPGSRPSGGGISPGGSGARGLTR